MHVMKAFENGIFVYMCAVVNISTYIARHVVTMIVEFLGNNAVHKFTTSQKYCRMKYFLIKC